MQDIIFINELQIETVIGIFDWERQIKQTVVLDLKLATDISKAAASDHIDDTIDYKTLTKTIITFVEASEFQLVETLAERVCELVRSDFNVAWVRLRLNKLGALRGARDVGILIERGSR
ncbi:Dihydroneopterin aldolase [hydrothermal vent metagenome]|uniref:dihydroneopterin aldolase n=1 Tax=hydrothermal vent metagenome TaxID=652676 RepID=A0A3B0ZWS6_9ZZZZ